MKTCTKCGVEKPREMFSKKKASADGLNYWCKACQKLYRKEHREEIAVETKRWREDRKEELAVKTKQYHEDHKEEIAANKKRYREDNKEDIVAYIKSYREDNKENIATSGKKYRKENTAKINVKTAKRRAQKIQSVPAWFEKEAVNLLYAKAQEWAMQVDHVIPLISDTVCGLHCHANLQLLDGSLNSSKGNRYEQDQ